ncbi:MAG: Holliday junction branch migration protein RuvA, partial [Rhodospirillaceae bacterium]|nr:Holliday junction branch migration protein RuvA [Rhodospirillaceae bacterium]
MIARLRGRIERIGEDNAVIDVGGVGYLVFCSGRTLSQLPGVGETVALEIETHVRE